MQIQVMEMERGLRKKDASGKWRFRLGSFSLFVGWIFFAGHEFSFDRSPRGETRAAGVDWGNWGGGGYVTMFFGWSSSVVTWTCTVPAAKMEPETWWLEDEISFWIWNGPFSAWRIIPVCKWLVTPIYKPFSPFGRGITLLRGLANHGY